MGTTLKSDEIQPSCLRLFEFDLKSKLLTDGQLTFSKIAILMLTFIPINQHKYPTNACSMYTIPNKCVWDLFGTLTDSSKPYQEPMEGVPNIWPLHTTCVPLMPIGLCVFFWCPPPVWRSYKKEGLGELIKKLASCSDLKWLPSTIRHLTSVMHIFLHLDNYDTTGKLKKKIFSAQY